MTKDEIIAVLAILRNQHWVGPRDVILNDTSYKLICSAIGKLEKNFLALAAFPLDNMKPKDLEVGEMYFARLRVNFITSDSIHVSFLDNQQNHVAEGVLDKSLVPSFSPINPKDN